MFPASLRAVIPGLHGVDRAGVVWRTLTVQKREKGPNHDGRPRPCARIRRAPSARPAGPTLLVDLIELTLNHGMFVVRAAAIWPKPRHPRRGGRTWRSSTWIMTRPGCSGASVRRIR